MIRFKNPEDEAKMESLDFRIHLLLELARLFSDEHNAPTLVVTDIDTPNVHMENSPHYHKRAIDLRLEPLGLKRWEEFAEWVHRYFDYGRGLRAVIVGKYDPHGRHNDHVHFQVPYPCYPKRVGGSISKLSLPAVAQISVKKDTVTA